MTDAKNWWPLPPQRAQIVAHLQLAAGAMSTAAMSRIAHDHPWFATLNAEHRSWIGVVANAGIKSFIQWFEAAGDSHAARSVFTTAPPVLARQITLQQTVDLVRSTVDSVADEIEKLPAEDQPSLQLAIVHYSREIAFAAAHTYATAAEQRGAWDARLEALILDAVVRGDSDTLLSRASTLGWSNPEAVLVIVGTTQDRPVKAIERLRRKATHAGIDMLAAAQGDRLVLVVGGSTTQLTNPDSLASGFAEDFGSGPLVIGPVVSCLSEAPRSARSALSGQRAAHAWPGAPQIIAATDLLPERALAGDGHARRQLVDEIYRPLEESGADLLATLSEFLEQNSGIEATARALYIHPNTVRYRLGRIREITNRSPSDSRDAYALRIALTLGRLLS